MEGLLIGILIVLAILLAVTLVIGLVVFWIWMIVDCAKRNFKKDSDKIIWILVIIFVQVIGAYIYYFVIKRKNKR